MIIRPANSEDAEPIWRILEPVIRAGETYPLPRDMGRSEALAYWLAPHHEAFVAIETDAIVGTYYLRANNAGGGAHVANCGYVVAGGRDRPRRGAGDVRALACRAPRTAASAPCSSIS